MGRPLPNNDGARPQQSKQFNTAAQIAAGLIGKIKDEKQRQLAMAVVQTVLAVYDDTLNTSEEKDIKLVDLILGRSQSLLEEKLKETSNSDLENIKNAITDSFNEQKTSLSEKDKNDLVEATKILLKDNAEELSDTLKDEFKQSEKDKPSSSDDKEKTTETDKSENIDSSETPSDKNAEPPADDIEPVETETEEPPVDDTKREKTGDDVKKSIISTVTEQVGKFADIVNPKKMFSNLKNVISGGESSREKRLSNRLIEVMAKKINFIHDVIKEFDGILKKPDKFLKKITGKVLTKAFKNIQQMLDKMVTKMLDGLIDTIIKGIDRLFNGILKSAMVFFLKILAGIILPLALLLFLAIQFIIKPLMEALKPLFEFLQPVMDAIGMLAKAAVEVLIPLMKTIWGAIGGALSVILNTIAGILKVIAPIVINLAKLLGEAISIIIKTLGILIKSIAPALFLVAKIVGNILVVVAEAIDILVKTIAPVLKVLAKIIGELLIIIGDIIKFLFDVLKPIVLTIINILKAIIMPVLDVLKMVIDAIGYVLVAAVKLIKAILLPIIMAIKIVIDSIFAIVSGIISVIVAIFKPIIWFMKLIISVINGIFKKIVSAFEKIMVPIKKIIDAIMEAVGFIFDTIIDLFVTVLEPILSAIATAIRLITFVIQMAVLPIIIFIKTVMLIVKGIVYTIEAIIDGVYKFINMVKKFFRKILNGLAGISIFGYKPFGFLGAGAKVEDPSEELTELKKPEEGGETVAPKLSEELITMLKVMAEQVGLLFADNLKLAILKNQFDIYYVGTKLMKRLNEVYVRQRDLNEKLNEIRNNNSIFALILFLAKTFDLLMENILTGFNFIGEILNSGIDSILKFLYKIGEKIKEVGKKFASVITSGLSFFGYIVLKAIQLSGISKIPEILLEGINFIEDTVENGFNFLGKLIYKLIYAIDNLGISKIPDIIHNALMSLGGLTRDIVMNVYDALCEGIKFLMDKIEMVHSLIKRQGEPILQPKNMLVLKADAINIASQASSMQIKSVQNIINDADDSLEQIDEVKKSEKNLMQALLDKINGKNKDATEVKNTTIKSKKDEFRQQLMETLKHMYEDIMARFDEMPPPSNNAMIVPMGPNTSNPATMENWR